MLKLGLLSMFVMAATMAVAGPGCSDNAIDRAYDCDQICDKYKACADANYDDGACGDRCRDAAGDSEAYEDKADECQSCIDDRSCVGAAFGCATECAGIVP
jgi:hypothetical protein